MSLLEKYDILVLDCDGIIFDSNNLKVQAFERTVLPWGREVADEFLSYVCKSFGSSRYVMFRKFIEDYLKKEFDQASYDFLIHTFSKQCEELYIEASFCKGFLSFMAHYAHKSFYVASGGDEAELSRVFDRRDITQLFKAVYGSPTRKTEILRKIKEANPGKSLLMVGDAESDLRASLDNGIDFIFVSKYSLDKDNMAALCMSNQIESKETLIELL